MKTIFDIYGIDESITYRFIIDSLIVEGKPELIREKDTEIIKGIKIKNVKFLYPDNPSLIEESNYLLPKPDSISAFWAV